MRSISAFPPPPRPHREPRAPERITLISASGACDLSGAEHRAVVWLVLRGHVGIRAREGDFILGPRDWIALEGDSSPQALLDKDALVLGIALGNGAYAGWSGESPDAAMLIAGRGQMAPGMRKRALRLWQALDALPEPGGGKASIVCRREAVQAFVAALQAEVISGIGRCPGHSGQRKLQILHRMQQARLCLEGQAAGGLRVGDIAKRSHFSPWYFSKIFHALYGEGPLQFAVRMRLQQASRLLATTRMPVTEVSTVCGFDSSCSFARAFRAQFGMTASEHRARNASGYGASRTSAKRGPRRQPSSLFVCNAR